MADLVCGRAACTVVPAAPPRLSFFAWLLNFRARRPRVGTAEDLPDRLRVDMGLEKHAPSRDYRDYTSPTGW